MDNQEAWSLLYQRIKSQDFSLKSIKLVKVNLEELIISSPTPSTLTRVKEKFLPLISLTWKDLTGNDVMVKVIKRDAALVPKVIDDGMIIRHQGLAGKRLSATRQKSSAEQSSNSDRPAALAETLSFTIFKGFPKEFRLKMIAAAVKQYYNLEDIQFLLPKPKLDDKYKEPRLMAIYLSKLYLGEKSNSDLTAFFGVTINSIVISYQKARRADNGDPGFKKASRAIQESLQRVLKTMR